MTMKPLNLLRELYRQLKTPAMHISKEIIQNNKNTTNTTKASVIEAASTTTTGNNKSRSNASTKFLIQQYRIAASVSSSPTDNTSTTTPTQVSHSNQHLLQQHRMAMEYYLLRQDIHQRGELYMIDTGADQQLSPHELSRRAAARAGLQLPEQYKE